MAATWSDLPPELVELIARALLRMCYTDVHRSRTTPREKLVADCGWRPHGVPAGSVGVLDLGLVDAPTWAAVAPASTVCRQLRGALLAAVGGLALRVPSLETDADCVQMEDDLPSPSELRAGSYADRYTTAWQFGLVGLRGMGGGALGRWLYFFPAADGLDEQTRSLAAFVRSCPQLRAVEVWDGYLPSRFQSMFILRSPATPQPPRRSASGAAPLVRRPAGSNTPLGATDNEAPLRLAVTQHLGCTVGVYFDHSWGFQAPGVALVAAEGGPTLHRRGTLRVGSSFDGRQDDRFYLWRNDHGYIAWMLEGLRLSREQDPPQGDASGTPAGSV